MTTPNPMALEAKALDAARTTTGQDELLQKNAAETSRLIAKALAKASPVLGGPEGDSILAYSIPSGLWLMLQANVRNLLDKLAALPLPAAGEGLEPVAAYHLVFDGFPSPDGPRFIELEDDNGRSFRGGEWVSRSDGLTELVLPRATPAARAAVLPDEVAIDRSLLEAACHELRKWKVEKGGDDQVVLNLEAALKEKT